MEAKRTNELKNIIESAFSELDIRLHGNAIHQLIQEISIYPEYHDRSLSIDPEDFQKLSALYRTMSFINASEEKKSQMTSKFQSLSSRVAFASSDKEKQQLILEFLELMIDDKKRLRGDRKAFRNYMELDVVSERYNKFIMQEEMLQKLAVGVIGTLTAQILRKYSDNGNGDAILQHLLSNFELQGFLLDRLRNTIRWQNKVAAFEALRKIIGAIPESHKFRMLDFNTSRSITRYCLNPRESAWIQIVALRLLTELSREEALRAFRVRLLQQEDDIPDNLFVRKVIVELIGECFADKDGFEILKALAEKKDKSEYVRMQLVKTIAAFPFRQAMYILRAFIEGKLYEDCPQVRAQAVIQWADIGKRSVENSNEELLRESMDILSWAIIHGNALLVQRVALEEAAELCNLREEILNKGEIDEYDKVILDAISRVLSEDDNDAKLRYWAEEAGEQIIVKILPEYKAMEENLLPKISKLKEGESITIDRSALPEDEDRIGRVLAFFSRKSFGIYMEMGAEKVKLTRGDRWHYSLWRFLYEIRNLSPDKRQGFSHTLARKFTGTIRAHPGIMAEETKTKVPGERLLIEHEGSWRRFIPLLDDYLSINMGKLAEKPVKIYSSYGITTIISPQDWLSRMRIHWKISYNYDKLNDLRNANPRDKEHPDPKIYLDTMREKYGMVTLFSPYTYEYNGQEYALRDHRIERLFAQENGDIK
jgi:hypothetical protein